MDGLSRCTENAFIFMLGHYSTFEKMIFKPKLAPATCFHRIFTQFQMKEGENRKVVEESMNGSKHRDQKNCIQGGRIVSLNKGDKVGKQTIDLKNECEQSKEDLNYLASENSHLVQALKKERKRSALLLSKLEDRKHLKTSDKTKQASDEKSLHPTSCSTTEGYLKKIHHLEEKIQDKMDTINNLCVLFMRLKSNKDVLKTKLEFQEAEFDEVSKDLIEKLAESRDEINCMADSRYHTMKDFRSASMIRVVQKNGQLSVENSMLRLETCRLKQRIFDLENDSAIVKVNAGKQELRTVPSRVSFSRSSLQSRSNESKYSGKTFSTVNGSAYWAGKKVHRGNKRCQSCQKLKYTKDEELTDFTNYLPGQSKQGQNTWSENNIDKYIDTRSAGDAQNEQTCERKYKFDEKPKQKSFYSHHHNTEGIFKKNARESLILQATSVKSDRNLELAPNVSVPQRSDCSSKFPSKETNSIKDCDDGNQRNLISRQCSEESLLPELCNLDDSKFNFNDDSETLTPLSDYLDEEIGHRNMNMDCQNWRQSSEESLLTLRYNLRGSKSAPEILERAEYKAASENTLFKN